MELKIYDVVKLKEDKEDLRVRGIQEGCYGVLMEINGRDNLVFS